MLWVDAVGKWKSFQPVQAYKKDYNKASVFFKNTKNLQITNSLLSGVTKTNGTFNLQPHFYLVRCRKVVLEIWFEKSDSRKMVLQTWMFFLI